MQEKRSEVSLYSVAARNPRAARALLILANDAPRHGAARQAQPLVEVPTMPFLEAAPIETCTRNAAVAGRGHFARDGNDSPLGLRIRNVRRDYVPVDLERIGRAFEAAGFSVERNVNPRNPRNTAWTDRIRWRQADDRAAFGIGPNALRSGGGLLNKGGGMGALQLYIRPIQILCTNAWRGESVHLPHKAGGPIEEFLADPVGFWAYYAARAMADVYNGLGAAQSVRFAHNVNEIFRTVNVNVAKRWGRAVDRWARLFPATIRDGRGPYILGNALTLPGAPETDRKVARRLLAAATATVDAGDQYLTPTDLRGIISEVPRTVARLRSEDPLTSVPERYRALFS